jgi:hypothetical protein
MERYKCSERCILPLCCLRWKLPTMGGCHYHLYHCLDHLCARDNVDPPTRLIPLDCSLHRLVCCCWNWCITFSWRGNQVSHWSERCSIRTVLHRDYLLLCCILGQLRCGLQRQDASQHPKNQNLYRDIYWDPRADDTRPNAWGRPVQRNRSRRSLETGL